MRDRGLRILAAALLASSVFAPRLSAQAGLGHLEDATTAPRGLLRLRAISSWTRYDSRFGAKGVAPLGAPFSADSLGVRQVPELVEIEQRVQSAIQSATAIPLPFTLTLGRSQLGATAREEVIPIGLEYGITDRFSVGVVVPVVRRRVTMLFRLDTAGGFAANVGPNLHRTNSTAAQNNALVQTEFLNARNQLQARLDACIANNTGPGCTTILTEAPQLIQSSQSFASTLAELYGSLTGNGLTFVPTSQSAAQAAIALRVSDFNTRYRALLGASADLIQAVPRAAGGPAGAAEFQSYLTEDLGRDSLTSQERTGIGDVEVGFKFRVLDAPRTEQRRTGVQFAIAGGVRMPTGSRQSPSEIVDLRLGNEAPIIDARALLDATAGRAGILAAAHFATKAGGAEPLLMGVSVAPTKESRWTEIHVAPRWHLSEPFAIHGAYSFRSTNVGSDQLVGGGVSVTSLARYRAGATPPVEMRFTHLEALNGDAGRPKFFRDQLEVRIYYRLMNR